MSFFDKLFDLLFPPRCAFCHAFIESGEGVCDKCRKELPFIPIGVQTAKCRSGIRCTAPFYYENTVRESLLRYKFGSMRSYSKIYDEFLAKCIDENNISCDIITWVPLSAQRLRSRGYDQARLIAEGTAQRLGIPCERLLDKVRNTSAQSGTGAYADRAKNIAGAFALHAGAEIKEKNILIIDDIVTTGATLAECARVLRLSGAKSVSAAAVAAKRRD